MTVLDRSLDNHDGVVQTPLNLGNELLGSTTQHEGASLRLGATLKQVEPFSTDLLLLEALARTEVLLTNIGAGRLDRSSDGLHDTLEVVDGDTSGTEDVTVGEELGGEISDGETREDDLGARCGNRLELVVDDGPLGVDDGLVLLQDERARGGSQYSV